MNRTLRILLLACVLPLPMACSDSNIGKATLEDKGEFAFWRDQVPPKRRDKIIADAKQRTDWSEKRQLVWCTTEFKHYALDEQRRARATAASKPATQPKP